MSAYILIGFFIDSIDELEKLKIYDIEKVNEETPSHNSCQHLPDEVYRSRSQRYCSECGVKIKIILGSPAIYRNVFIGYNPELFGDKLIPTKRCKCALCNMCECVECQDDCSKCKCTKCKMCYMCEKDILDCVCRISHVDKRCKPNIPDICDVNNYYDITTKECNCFNKIDECKDTEYIIFNSNCGCGDSSNNHKCREREYRYYDILTESGYVDNYYDIYSRQKCNDSILKKPITDCGCDEKPQKKPTTDCGCDEKPQKRSKKDCRCKDRKHKKVKIRYSHDNINIKTPKKDCGCNDNYQKTNNDQCTCDMINYDVPIDKLRGYMLSCNYILTMDNEFGPIILYESFKVNIKDNEFKINFEELNAAKLKIDEFTTKLEIKGKFDIKIKFITCKPNKKMVDI